MSTAPEVLPARRMYMGDWRAEHEPAHTSCHAEQLSGRFAAVDVNGTGSVGLVARASREAGLTGVGAGAEKAGWRRRDCGEEAALRTEMAA